MVAIFVDKNGDEGAAAAFHVLTIFIQRYKRSRKFVNFAVE